MKRFLRGALTVALVSSVFGLAGAEDNQPVEKKDVASQAPMPSVCHVCDKCCKLSMQAGTCGMCKGEKKGCHVLAIKDGMASCCMCSADCKCDMAGVKDGKCACGKGVKEVSVKGMYVCACAGGKCCASVSDKPGKCGCGVEMKKVE